MLKKALAASMGLLLMGTTIASNDSFEGLYDNFGNGDFEITLRDATSTSVTIDIPVISIDFDVIEDYELLYSSEGDVFDLLELDNWEELLESEAVSSADAVDDVMSLTINNLDDTKTYYFGADYLYDASPYYSNTIKINLADVAAAEIEAEEETQQQETHNAGPDLTSPTFNFTHTQDPDDLRKVRFTWTPQVPSDVDLEMFIRHSSDANFSSLTTVPMVEASYSTTLPAKQGTYFVRIIPVDRFGNTYGKETIYTMNGITLPETELPPVATGTPATTTTTNTNGQPLVYNPGTVPTGPKENALAILGGALLLYGIYRMRKKRKKA